LGRKYDSYNEEQKAAVSWQAQQMLDRLMDQGEYAGVNVQNNPEAFLNRLRDSLDPDKALKLFNLSRQNGRHVRKDMENVPTGQMGRWNRKVMT
jgi:hypothetical protein